MWYGIQSLYVLLVLAVSGSSAPPRPLKRLAHPSTLALEILPRTPVAHGTLFTRSLESPTLRHTDSLRLTLAAFGRKHRLHLRPNHHLIHPAARVNYYASDGSISRTEPLLRSSVLVYEGEVIDEAYSAHRLREDAAGGVSRPWDEPPGIAPVYEGAFSVLGETYHILTRDNYIRTRGPLDLHPDRLAAVNELDGGLVIFRDSDVERPPLRNLQRVPMMGLASTPRTTSRSPDGKQLPPSLDHTSPWYDPFGFLEPVPKMGMLSKRDDVAGPIPRQSRLFFVDQIGNTAGCSKTQKLVYMGVAADCEYTTQAGGSQAATTRILNNWNTAIELAIQDSTCPTGSANPAWNVQCTSSVTLNDRLSLFSAWRGERGGASGSGAGDSAGLWHLMSGCPTGTEVGVAWLGQVCNTRSSGSQGNVVSGTAVSTAGRTEWQVVAHEIGHNFGAIHDHYMRLGLAVYHEPRVKFGRAFSPCSIGNICSVLAGSVDSSCLQEADTAAQTISLQMCGNGIVEAGEGQSLIPHTPSFSLTTSSIAHRLRPRRRHKLDLLRQHYLQIPAQRRVRPQLELVLHRLLPIRALDPGVPPVPRRDVRQGRDVLGLVASCPSDQVTRTELRAGAGVWRVRMGYARLLTETDGTIGVAKSRVRIREHLTSAWSSRPTWSMGLHADTAECNNGSCQSGSALDTAKAWYTSNLQISIPVTVVVGIIVLLILWGCLRCVASCCGCRRDKTKQRISSWVPPATGNPAAWNSGAGWNRGAAGGPQAPPSTHQPNQRPSSGDGHARLTRARSNWVDDQMYNGPNYRS
ncbi:Sanke disintergrin [Rhizoctonia solani]|uniref:Sanke disintergrin n=1 Tax=Rhizoctonia solani TaxID=456999 RepID=A0A8H7M9C2_9AGAM|nr:Sanke disintergrin [Rhizoctonia solani]